MLKIQSLFVVMIAVSVMLPVTGCSQAAEHATILTAEQANDMIKADSSVVLLDVRTPGEFASSTGHLAGAMLIPVQELEQRAAELEPLKDRPILVYCRSGSRSSRAIGMLADKGYKLYMLDGGITDWLSAGYPTEGGAGQ